MNAVALPGVNGLFVRVAIAVAVVLCQCQFPNLGFGLVARFLCQSFPQLDPVWLVVDGVAIEGGVGFSQFILRVAARGFLNRVPRPEVACGYVPSPAGKLVGGLRCRVPDFAGVREGLCPVGGCWHAMG